LLDRCSFYMALFFFDAVTVANTLNNVNKICNRQLPN
jgi:hypothetical protein